MPRADATWQNSPDWAGHEEGPPERWFSADGVNGPACWVVRAEDYDRLKAEFAAYREAAEAKRDET